MKGLRKYLTPFAPDQSGAVSMLYEAGGLIIIVDAGGCTGNVCDFDEPRWESSKSAIFSAGLRDMDAILGRDDLLIKKIKKVMTRLDASFIALIGTPVPAVIGTDLKGLAHILETQIHKKVITCDTSGVFLYDTGIEKALNAFVKAFVDDQKTEKEIGVLGFTPLDYTCPKNKHYNYYDTIEDVVCAGSLKKNYVASMAGLKIAKYMERTYSIPYEIGYPDDLYPDINGNHVLAITTQAIGLDLAKKCPDLTIASYFMMKKAYMRGQDVILKEEDDLIDLVRSHDYDVIIGDRDYQRMLPFYKGKWIPLEHFAVSGSKVIQ